MPYRLVKFITPLVATGDTVAAGSAGVAVFGAISDGSVISITAAFVAALSVLVPRLIDAYRGIRTARRLENEADIKSSADLIYQANLQRAELAAQLAATVRENQARIEAQALELAALKGGVAIIKGSMDGIKDNVAGLSQEVKVVKSLTPDPDGQTTTTGKPLLAS
jgi:hypothetical protein